MPTTYDTTTQRRIVRRVLRDQLPGVAFNVIPGHHGAIIVEWVDGPTVANVENVVLYELGAAATLLLPSRCYSRTAREWAEAQYVAAFNCDPREHNGIEHGTEAIQRVLARLDGGEYGVVLTAGDFA